MPFDQLFPRSFTEPAIRAYAPALSGVYGLSNSARWLYIGESGNIQESLLAYCRDSTSTAADTRPSGFVFEVCGPALRSARRQRLIQEYSPAANLQRRQRP